MGFAGFEEFVTEHRAALLRSAYLLTGERHRAEDLVQQALTKLAERWDRIGPSHPEAFVRTVLYRDAVSGWRKLRRERVTETPPDVAGWGDLAEDVTRRQELLRALADLTPKQRAVLVLRYFDDLTESQTAAVLGVRVGTVKSQTHLALRRMREQMQEVTA
ncbi:SigE family RNA polymerase sigma factor [Lentzea tibetensis]|uniref:SigE family RNA polymerase sigma factor n=1 Tax=Lentzea tibetensis TaxID=2591470 RepID=A0A563EIU6_9PSEU|nr:SigE family RNA polymerase sigma factor [Lentzea tibetensis]TWP46755.1 SigE family RNA polymerase sigma factor [Lentzea tibetensis]